MNKYSIILPLRNGGYLVKECIQSILSQTLQNFELLILDNKSTDGTSEWLRTLQDKRVKIYPSIISLSIEENWSRILNVPKNEFSTLIGHDDILMPEYLETMDNLIHTNPDAKLYQTHFEYIDATGNKIRNCLPMNDSLSAEEFVGKALQRNLDINGTGYMFRSVDYDAINGIPLYPKLMFADYALWFSMIQNGKIAISKTHAFKYRIHQNTSQLADPIVYSDALKQFTTFLEKLSKVPSLHNCIKESAPPFISHFCKSISHKLLRYTLTERKNITVSQLVKTFEKKCAIISGNPHYSLKKESGIKSALLIDSNPLTRQLFRMIRKAYNKPVLK